MNPGPRIRRWRIVPEPRRVTTPERTQPSKVPEPAKEPVPSRISKQCPIPQQATHERGDP